MRTCTLADVTEVVGRMERVSRWLEKQEQLLWGSSLLLLLWLLLFGLLLKCRGGEVDVGLEYQSLGEIWIQFGIHWAHLGFSCLCVDWNLKQMLPLWFYSSLPLVKWPLQFTLRTSVLEINVPTNAKITMPTKWNGVTTEIRDCRKLQITHCRSRSGRTQTDDCWLNASQVTNLGGLAQSNIQKEFDPVRLDKDSGAIPYYLRYQKKPLILFLNMDPPNQEKHKAKKEYQGIIVLAVARTRDFWISLDRWTIKSYRVWDHWFDIRWILCQMISKVELTRSLFSVRIASGDRKSEILTAKLSHEDCACFGKELFIWIYGEIWLFLE